MNKIFGLVAFLVLVLTQATFAQIKLGGAEGKLDLNYLEPKEYEIGALEITGTKFLDPASLIGLTGLKVGDVITVPGDKLSSALRKLWDFGILADVKVVATKVEGKLIFLEFQLKERPRLARFAIKGAKKGQADDIREKINLIRGRVVTDALIKNTQNTVKKFFVEKGYLNCKVLVKQDEDTALNNSVVLRIEIDKGTKVKIKYIAFEGNTFYTDEQLRRKLKDTKEKRIWRLFKTSKYIRSNYETDKEKLIAFYNKNGYRDAEVMKDSLVKLSNNEVALNIRIDEGKRFYFRNINWTGNYLYTNKELSDVLGIKTGDIYNQETLQKKITYNPAGIDVSSLYMDDGYLFFNVEPVEVKVDNDSIDIEMRITEGTQATIRKVSVFGNTKTNDQVIMREIRTLPGQKFSRSDLIRTQREISQLGYFNPETIDIQPIPHPEDGTVDINYTVEERPSDQIELSGGWGGFFGFVGTLGLSFNNFSMRKVANFKEWTPLPGGDGQRLSIRFQANGRQFQTYSMSFTEPWLGGKKPTSLTVAFSHSVQRTLSSTDRKLRVTGGSVSIGKRLKYPDDFFTALFSANLNRYSLINYPFPELDPVDGIYPNLDATNFNLATTFARNSINNPTFPSTGSNISLTVSLTPPYSLFRDKSVYQGSASQKYNLIEYNKWMFDASWFVPIAKNLVFHTRTHMGFVGNYQSSTPIGPFERFKVGGAGLAGFNFLLGYDIIGLRGYQDAIVFNERRDRSKDQAGVLYNKYVTELRYAISTNPSATIFALAFFEGGNNYLSYEKYNPFKVYRSAGVGARIFMPQFGLIGLDFGKALDNLPGETNGGRQTFTFTIGQQIR